jgi:hypothetical protein
MAKRKRGFTREKYEKWLKEGRGKGEGRKYKPWLTIQDVAGDGNATRIHGIKFEYICRRPLAYLAYNFLRGKKDCPFARKKPESRIIA